MVESSNEKRSMSDFQDILNLISEPVTVVDDRLEFVCVNQTLARTIEAYRGTITVQTTKERGTIFSINLPITDNMNAEVKEIG